MILDDQTKAELVALVKNAVNEAVEQHPLSPDEVHWVRMAIQAEADRAAFRKAVIDKSLAGVIWMILATGGGYLVDFCVVDFNIEERYARSLKAGKHVSLRVQEGETMTGKKGKIVFVSSVAERASALVKVKVEFENRNGTVIPGVIAQISF